jgi:hypothetical protein
MKRSKPYVKLKHRSNQPSALPEARGPTRVQVVPSLAAKSGSAQLHVQRQVTVSWNIQKRRP